MLIENTLFGIQNKINIAIDRLKEFEPVEGYYLAFSGGKDSVVILALANMAKVKYDVYYNLTTIDPPELVRFIRRQYPDVKFEYPKRPFLQEMIKRGFPMRKSRWCCEEYKEKGGTGRMVITGIRWGESNRRSKRKMIEFCYKDKTKKYMNVIIDWTENDVWKFIHKYNIPYCKLYDEGFKRIGCLFCPMARLKTRLLEKKRYPKWYKLFEKYFIKLYEYRKEKKIKSVNRWKNGKEMFEWWFYNIDNSKKIADQMVMFE